MVINEGNRHRLYRRLEEILGPQEATILMEHLPPVGWADVATKSDIEGLRAATKSDIEGLRLSTTSEFGSVRSDLEGFRNELKSDIENLSLRMDAGRHEILGRMERELRLLTWRFMTVVVAIASVAIASPHF
jgi:hypothetical protein